MDINSLIDEKTLEMRQEDALEREEIEEKIPIPTIEHLTKTYVNNTLTHSRKKLPKWEREFDLFCRWAALPKNLRDPKTAVAFESKYTLPKNYTSIFKQHEDFQSKRLKYFYDWLFDLYPDVVYAVYKRALQKSSRDASIFVDLIGKQLETHKPQMTVAPMVIMGIPQEKINALFVPKDYDKVIEVKGK